MPVYTRTGDSGLTGLLGGTRVPKQSARVEAYGTVDEANAALGYAKVLCADEATRDTIDAIQQRLSILAAELASDGTKTVRDPIGEGDITGLERLIDEAMAVAGSPTGFVTPGDDPASAALHQARTVVRRAERRILAAAESAPVRPELVTYVNRLSDALYALAMATSRRAARDRLTALVREAVHGALGVPPATGVTPTGFGLGSAQAMAAAAEAAARAAGVPVVFAAVDAGGHPVLVHRMDDSLLASLELAVDKAFTAAALRRPTADLAHDAAADGALNGIGSTHHGRIVTFGGGLPLFIGGCLAGGIGVSGGTVDQDVAIVTQALRAIQASPQEGTA